MRFVLGLLFGVMIGGLLAVVIASQTADGQPGSAGNAAEDQGPVPATARS